MKRADIIMAALLMTGSVAGYVTAGTFRGEAALMPRIILACLFLAALALLANALRGKSTEQIASVAWKRWGLAAGLSVGYLLLIVLLGFYAATALYIFFTLYLFGERRWSLLLGTALGFNLLIYLTFSLGLSIVMPPPFFLN